MLADYAAWARPPASGRGFSRAAKEVWPVKIRLALECSTSVLGGFERFLLTLVAVLREQGIEPMLVANEDGPVLPHYLSLGVAVEVISARERAGRLKLAGLLRDLHIDIAQSHSFDPGFAMASRQAGCRNVWRLKGHVRLSCPDDAEQAERLLGLGSALADRIVCPSHFLARQFDEHSADKVSVIPNGVELDGIEQGASRPRVRSSRRLVASVGHLVPSKHHEVFLRAAARLKPAYPDCDFAIFGQPSGNPDYAEYLSDLVEGLELDPGVLRGSFRGGFVDMLEPIDVAVFPFIDEGFGNAAVEAMAVGKAVVAARSGVFPEHIDHGVDGILVEPRDPVALSAAISELLDDPVRAQSLARAARHKARTRWDQRLCARRYADLYLGLVSHG